MITKKSAEKKKLVEELSKYHENLNVVQLYDFPGNKVSKDRLAEVAFKKHEIDPKIYKGKYDWQKLETPFGQLFVIELKKE